jgi:hypothetical protein
MASSRQDYSPYNRAKAREFATRIRLDEDKGLRMLAAYFADKHPHDWASHPEHRTWPLFLTVCEQYAAEPEPEKSWMQEAEERQRQRRAERRRQLREWEERN